MKSPEVSVVLPVYNAAQTIERAMQSILDQSYVDFELIVVENGSDRATHEKIAQFQDSRIKNIILEKPDVANAFNAGVRKSKCRFIARMDSDDVSHPDRLLLQLAYLKNNTKVDIVSCLVEFQSSLTHSDGFHNYVKWQNSLVEHSDIYANRFVESPLVNPSCMFTRRVFETIGEQRSGDFPEDYDFWLRALSHGFHVEKINKVLFTWHDHASRLTRTDSRYSELAFHKLKSTYLFEDLRKKSVGIAEPSNQVDRKLRPLVIWGAGKVSRKYSRLLLHEGFLVSAYIDIDLKKIGKKVKGVDVHSPDILSQIQNPFILSYVPGLKARHLIEAHLQKEGFEVDNDFYCLA